MARAFSTFANGGARVDGALLGNHAARDRLGGRGRQAAAAWTTSRRRTAQVLSPKRRRDHHLDPRSRSSAQGTGRRAALADRRAVAGKTGTTENYGDAWFVGYTPQLAVAVWVGYPDRLQPMLHEFNGDPVAGGTYPALIWQTFMEQALAYLSTTPPEYFPAAVLRILRASYTVAYRDGRWRARQRPVQGHADRSSTSPGRQPAKTRGLQAKRGRRADRGRREGPRRRARLRGAAAPGRGDLPPGERRGAAGDRRRAVPEERERCRRSSTVRLVVAKPLHGVIPKVVGSAARAGEAEARGREARERGEGVRRRHGRASSSRRHPRPASPPRPRRRSRLIVGRNARLTNREPRQPVAPGQIRRLR